tara:strand:+ start:4076 stop:4309 length:234 start_codon:yes stop_codon:yes gene_type:complete
MDEEHTNTHTYFGVCPICGKQDGYLNIQRDHWFVCHEHKIRWHVGSNIFSQWREENPDIWQRNKARIVDYEDISDLS